MSITYGQLEKLLKRLPAEAYPSALEALLRLQSVPRQADFVPRPASHVASGYAPVYPSHGYPPPYYPSPAYAPPFNSPYPPTPPSPYYPSTPRPEDPEDDEDDDTPGGSTYCEDKTDG